MPKLYFRYGTMNSSKTMNLLMVAHNYEAQQKKVIVIKPKIDTRFGKTRVASRTGIQRTADLIVDDSISLKHITNWGVVECVLCDEANLLSVKQINELREITKYCPVICYGLRTDYMTNLFPASKRLMEIADSIEEVKTTCMFCNRKAVVNLKHCDGKIIKQGSSDIDIGAEEKYLSSCWECWHQKIEI